MGHRLAGPEERLGAIAMSWLSRFVSVIRSDRLNRDLDDEMRFHLDARTEEYTKAVCPSRKHGPGSPPIRQPRAPA